MRQKKNRQYRTGTVYAKQNPKRLLLVAMIALLGVIGIAVGLGFSNADEVFPDSVIAKLDAQDTTWNYIYQGSTLHTAPKYNGDGDYAAAFSLQDGTIAYCASHYATTVPDPEVWNTYTKASLASPELSYVAAHGYKGETTGTVTLGGKTFNTQFVSGQQCARLATQYCIWLITGEQPKFQINDDLKNAAVALKTEAEAYANNGGQSTTYLYHYADGYQDILISGRSLPQKYNLTVTKTDADTGKTVAKSGFEFALYSDAACTKEISRATTDDSGTVSFKDLDKNTYYVKETKAAGGYKLSTDVLKADCTGGDTNVSVSFNDTPVKSKFSIVKKDKNSGEIIKKAGFQFALYDNEKCSGTPLQTATTDDNGIATFNPIVSGTYYIKETKAVVPYAVAAKPVKVVIDATDKNEDIQTSVDMIDDVGSTDDQIQGQLDKRQEIADPIAVGTNADTTGKNKAKVSLSDNGYYDYSLDYRDTSNELAKENKIPGEPDEFTITDTLDGVIAGYARLQSITTAQFSGDYDGLMNVWYKTNLTDESYADDEGKANATLDDGHQNPYLASWFRAYNPTLQANDPDGDNRVLSYAGWKLWKSDVSTTEATMLNVSDLNLTDGEYITGFRFEYGNVAAGSTTRTSDWNRDNLKDEHDDLDDITPTHDETFTDKNGNTVNYAPAVVHMQLTDKYVTGVNLDNSAVLDEYQNGGGENHESHDSDKVTQTPQPIELHTSAVDSADGDKTVKADKDSAVDDTVEYHGLTPGQEYTITGTLHLRDSNGNDIGVCTDADGKTATGSVTFTPDSSDGTVKVHIAFDALDLDGKTVVAFEKATRKKEDKSDKEVGNHEDITDDEQAVTVSKGLLQTGDMIAVAGTVAGVAAAAAIAIFITRKVRNR